MNPVSSTIIDGVRIFYPTTGALTPNPDSTMPSFCVRVIEGWHWLYVFHGGRWQLAYEHPLPHRATVITAAIRFARQRL